nr:methyltransferase [Nitrospiraceae bacterium]
RGVPIFAAVTLVRRDVARRLGDMTGYTTREKAATVIASLSTYPFMVLTLFTPFSPNTTALIAGAAVYAAGLIGFLLSVLVFSKTPSQRPATGGVYRISRNPMYVSALFVFAGITIMTLDLRLAVALIVIAVLQHGMILAEERMCHGRYGRDYEEYLRRTPRYLFK